MAGMKIACDGDTGSHGGKIVASLAGNFQINGKTVAVTGDIYMCDKHGSQKIARGSSKFKVNGYEVARVGDKTSCGATIMSGASKVTDGG